MTKGGGMSDEIQLSAEQQEILKTLVDPDTPQQDRKYDFDKAIQQDILALMIHERSFMIQATHLIKPNYFVDKAHVLLCNILIDWFAYHVKAVTGQSEEWIQERYIYDQLSDALKDNPAKSYYLGETKTIVESYVQGLTSRTYCLDRISNFAKDQAIRIAVAKTVDLVKSTDKDKYDKLKYLWDETLLVGPQMDMGLSYFEDIEERYLRMEKDREGKDRFCSGFAEIDEAIVGCGLSRGEIGSYQAMSGAGKSWMLCKAAIENVRRGHKVLFITLEMNQDKTAERFDTLLTNTHMEHLISAQKVVKKKLDVEIKMAMNTLGSEDRKRLYIKHFAAGSADMHVIRAYYSQMALRGFKPDMLCLDYVGELKDFPGMKTYESRQRLVRDLRAFGTEENHCTLTAMQSNRAGRFAQDGGFIDDSEIGDSYGQVRVMDAVWNINQTPKEKKAGVGRIFVVKHRNGKSRYHFCYHQDPATLAIKSISDSTWKDMVSAVKELKDGEKVMEEYKVENIDDLQGGGFQPNGGMNLGDDDA
jgi:hypothetical protein